MFISYHAVVAVLVLLLARTATAIGSNCWLICDQTNRMVADCYDKYAATFDVWDEYQKCYCGLGAHFVSCYSCTDSEAWAQKWLAGFDEICESQLKNWSSTTAAATASSTPNSTLSSTALVTPTALYLQAVSASPSSSANYTLTSANYTLTSASTSTSTSASSTAPIATSSTGAASSSKRDGVLIVMAVVGLGMNIF